MLFGNLRSLDQRVNVETAGPGGDAVEHLLGAGEENAELTLARSRDLVVGIDRGEPENVRADGVGLLEKVVEAIGEIVIGGDGRVVDRSAGGRSLVSASRLLSFFSTSATAEANSGDSRLGKIVVMFQCGSWLVVVAKGFSFGLAAPGF